MIKSKKLNQLKYKLDDNNTLVIEIDQNTILKISELELVTISAQILKRQAMDTKLSIANNAFNLLLNFLQIPQEIIDKIERNKITDKNIDPLELFLKTQIVECNETEFNVADFKPFNLNNIEDIIQKIKEKNFLVQKIDQNNIIVKINGEK